MFEVPWGADEGMFQYEESELGFERDTCPKRYVRGLHDEFFFLEPGRIPRLTRFSGAGDFLGVLELVKHLPALGPADVLTPQDVFQAVADWVSVLLRVYLCAEGREELYLAHLSPAGDLERLVHFRDFRRQSFEADSAAFVDREGYLWTLLDGGGCEVYDPSGDHYQSLDVSGSYVDPEGHLYDTLDPITLYDRHGRAVMDLHSERPASPQRVDGGDGRDRGFEWQYQEQQQEGDTYILPRVLNLYRIDKSQASLLFLRTVVLPSSRYRVPDPGLDHAERTELYEDRLCFDEKGNVYFLGRSPHKCWMVKVATGIG